MLTGEKPEVSRLKIFGCPVYLLVPKEKSSKLDPSRKKGIFVGYSDQSKSYRVYIPGYHHIDINRSVIFDEDATFSKSRKIHANEDQEEEHEAPIVEETCNIPLSNVEEEHL